MSTYKAPHADLRFALHDVLGVDREFAALGYDEVTPDIVDAVLEEAARFTETVLAPIWTASLRAVVSMTTPMS